MARMLAREVPLSKDSAARAEATEVTRGDRRRLEVDRLDRGGTNVVTKRDARLERVAARRGTVSNHPLHVTIAGIIIDERRRVAPLAIERQRGSEHSRMEIDKGRRALDRHPHRAAAHSAAGHTQRERTLCEDDLADARKTCLERAFVHELLQQRDMRQVVVAIEL